MCWGPRKGLVGKIYSYRSTITRPLSTPKVRLRHSHRARTISPGKSPLPSKAISILEKAILKRGMIGELGE